MKALRVLTASFLLALPGIAHAKDAKCLLVVDGTVFLDGPCTFQPPLDIEARKKEWRTTNAGERLLVAEVYTQTMQEAPGVISGYFGAGYALHAHGNLGTLRREKADKACWSNDFARLCAW